MAEEIESAKYTVEELGDDLNALGLRDRFFRVIEDCCPAPGQERVHMYENLIEVLLEDPDQYFRSKHPDQKKKAKKLKRVLEARFDDFFRKWMENPCDGRDPFSEKSDKTTEESLEFDYHAMIGCNPKKTVLNFTIFCRNMVLYSKSFHDLYFLKVESFCHFVETHVAFFPPPPREHLSIQEALTNLRERGALSSSEQDTIGQLQKRICKIAQKHPDAKKKKKKS